MRDFTLRSLELLFQAILRNGYMFISYEQYITQDQLRGKYIILRHDVDAKPRQALKVAHLEHKYGIKGSYYIRNQTEVFKKDIISHIAALGHEIGYHYEDLSTHDGNTEKAIRSFESFLHELRTIYPVKTICMHGSPLSRHDNRDLWKTYDYKFFGILAELYIDTPFNRHWYLTDTGRGWNSRFSVRDKVSNAHHISVSNTKALIEKFDSRKLPPRMMINIHPQRWTNNIPSWLYERITQPVKNIIKLFFIYNR